MRVQVDLPVGLPLANGRYLRIAAVYRIVFARR
jgi:hypothetical protein